MVRRRTQATVIIAVLVVLAVVIVGLAQLNRSSAQVAKGSLAVTQDGRTLRTFTLDDIKALPPVTATKTILSSSHADETAAFTGVPLRVLLAAIRPDLLAGSSLVVTRAADGHVSALSAEEVAAGDSIILAYAKDGESLGTAADGGSGPFRIIVFSDTYGTRSTRWVNEIELR